MNSTLRDVLALAAVSLSLVGPAGAQTSPLIPLPTEPKKTPDPPPSRSTQITGRIKAVEGNILTFTDGRQLVFLPGVTEQRGELQPGASIKASYAETAGRKVAVSIHVDEM